MSFLFGLACGGAYLSLSRDLQIQMDRYMKITAQVIINEIQNPDYEPPLAKYMPDDFPRKWNKQKPKKEVYD